MKKKFYVTGIVYDTDGVVINGLPKTLVVECEDEEEVIDAISDQTGWCVESVEDITELEYDYLRGDYAFRYTFDAGLNRNTLRCDVEGSDVYRTKDNGFLGHIDDITPGDIREMDDKKFDDFLRKNHFK